MNQSLIPTQLCHIATYILGKLICIINKNQPVLLQAYLTLHYSYRCRNLDIPGYKELEKKIFSFGVRQSLIRKLKNLQLWDIVFRSEDDFNNQFWLGRERSPNCMGLKELQIPYHSASNLINVQEQVYLSLRYSVPSAETKKLTLMLADHIINFFFLGLLLKF